MVNAAVLNAPNTEITAVTILTSLSQNDMGEIGLEGTPELRAIALAKLAVGAGAKAIVCSPLEISGIRQAIPSNITIITPGIRPKGSKESSAKDDQKRTMDPKGALNSGANFLVIGRPITGDADVAIAARKILEEALS